MIHQYKLNGYNIILDTYSGSVHVTDDVAYDAVEGLDAGKPRSEIASQLLDKYKDRGVSGKDIEDTFSDIDELISQGKLFSEDIFKDKAFDLKNRSNVVKALCLLVAHTCNLNCSYCFASQGKFHGQQGLMDFETGKRALDFLVENSGLRKNLEVDFFGGEPLVNFEVCKQLVAYARSIEKEKNKNFRFTLTTNGVNLTDEVIEWANRECYNVVLSLDGRKEVNDRFRVDKNGNGSYDRIVPNFQRLVKARGGKGYYMRGTFTHYNTDFTKDIFHMADDLGFDQLSMEPVVTDPSNPSALTEEDLPVIYHQYEILAKDMIRREKEGKPITFYHYMINLTEGPCIYKRISGCGSGTEYMAVTAWGDLYPCHQFVGDEQYRLGDGIYAVPEQQTFNVMFYRKDVLDELGLQPPNTWQELIEMLPTIQGNNLSVAIPTAAGSSGAASASTSIMSNVPDLSMYFTLLFQYGGDMYTPDGIKTTVNTEAGVEAFDDYVRYFNDYGIPTIYDFVSRFRSGEMPVGISPYSTYNTLMVSAPEIRGLWDFTVIPGTERVDENGKTYIDRSDFITGNATMMIKTEDEALRQKSWEFMKWWANADTQVRFGREIEALLGSSARYATANRDAFSNLSWSTEDLKVLDEQWDQTRGIREVPGGYFTGRHISNAIRKVINEKVDSRETIIDYSILIDEEIKKKRIEFGMPVY